MAFGADLPPQLTLPEALNIALTNSTVLREAVAQLDEASGQYRQSRSALLPQLGVFARMVLVLFPALLGALATAREYELGTIIQAYASSLTAVQ
jgi:outer membrane protein TolC